MDKTGPLNQGLRILIVITAAAMFLWITGDFIADGEISYTIFKR